MEQNLTEQILRKSNHDIVLACAILQGPGSRRVVMYTAEYGDGDGIAHVDEFIRDARRLLGPDEQLTRQVARIGGADLFDETPATKPIKGAEKEVRRQRVWSLLRSSEWVTTMEINGVEAGGSEGCRQLREIRAEVRKGNHPGYRDIACEKAPGETSQYRYRLVEGDANIVIEDRPGLRSFRLTEN